MNIRARIFTVIGIVVAAALLQTLAVIYIENGRANANREIDRSVDLSEKEAFVARIISELQSTQLAYFITGDPQVKADYDQLWSQYEGQIGLLQQFTDDREQRLLITELDRLVQDWHINVSLVLMERREQGVDVAEPLTQMGPLRVQRIRSTLDKFSFLQERLLRDQRRQANDLYFRSTLLTLAIPTVAIVMLLILVFVLARILLDPLATVAESARQISGGNFNVKLPPASKNELGALVKAFRDMSGAVQRRQRDLTEALSREREISQLYATLRTNAEQEHARLLATIATVPAALIILEAPSGRIVLQNKAAEDLIGREPQSEAERRRYWRQYRVMNKDRTICPPQEWGTSRALAGEVVVGQELVVIHPDGRIIPLLMSAAPLRDEKGEIAGAVAGFQDITKLYEVDRMKNEFVSTVSHELRTPLTSIKGALQLLLDEVGPGGDPDHETLMNVALTNTDRLIRIINDILDISKIEAGKLTLQPKLCDVIDLVRQSVQSVEQIARGSSVELVTFVPPALPQVMVDPDRTIQAIVNLLSNALKYAPEGSVVMLRVTFELDGRISLAVIDRGKGIPSDKLTKLFQKFQQIDGSDSRRFPGTGLGLAISKALIEQQGGTISVESQTDVGTTFTISLPSVRTEALIPFEQRGDATAVSLDR